MSQVTEKDRRNTLVVGQLIGADSEYLYLEILEGYEEFLCIFSNRLFNINAFGNRISYQLQLNALEYIKTQKLFDVLVKNSLMDAKPSIRDQQKVIFDSGIATSLNDEQRIAVHSIINRSSYPLPFLLFGPPGTGKTRTIVAAIEQIVRTTERAILVCAQSNMACDELTDRLLNVLNGEHMVYRMYAKSFDKDAISPKFRNCSNFKGDGLKFPCLQFLYQFRVVVCTIATAGCLTRARRLDKNFSSTHFSHVFIDEAACCHETVTMIPIAGEL